MLNEDKTTRRPVIDPLLLALKSRRVLVALAALLTGLAVMAVPELATVHTEMLTLIITLALAVIGGYSLEDAATVARRNPPSNADVKQLMREVVDAVLDAIDARG